MLEEVKYIHNHLETGPVPRAVFKISVGWVVGGGKSRKGTEGYRGNQNQEYLILEGGESCR